MIVVLTKKRSNILQVSTEIANINRKIRLLSEEILTARLDNNKFNLFSAKFDQKKLKEDRDELIEILKKL